MKRITCIAALLLATGTTAQAQDYFGGISVIAPGSTHLDTTDGGRITSTNDPLRFKVYGGKQLSEHFALETGLTFFGKDRFTAPGGGELGISSNSAYIAARGTLPIGDSFEVFARAGLTAQRFRASNHLGEKDSESGVSGMLGLGVGYKLTDKLTLTLEVEHFGRVSVDKGHLGRGGISAGMNTRF